ncbi:MAG: 30S ribosomal protein S24e [Candidatus Bathyarchaeota archaeon]|nr:30S ribosomal protein S24e [Candidatus Bathyarchaeota archaeon]
MEIKIVSQKENPLLKRKEVQFQVNHGPKGKTPARLDVKRSLAAALQVSDQLVFIKRMKTLTGTSTAMGVATAYETVEQAKLIEPAYIIKRNSPPEKPKEEAKQ